MRVLIINKFLYPNGGSETYMICCSEFMKTKMDSNPLFATKTVAMHNFIDKVEWNLWIPEGPQQSY